MNTQKNCHNEMVLLNTQIMGKKIILILCFIKFVYPDQVATTFTMRQQEVTQVTLLSYRAPGSQWDQGLTVSHSGTTCMGRLWTPSTSISRVATGLGVQSGPGVTPRDSSGSKPQLTLEARGMSRYGQNKKCLLLGNPTTPSFFFLGGGGGGATQYFWGHLRFF